MPAVGAIFLSLLVLYLSIVPPKDPKDVFLILQCINAKATKVPSGDFQP